MLQAQLRAEAEMLATRASEQQIEAEQEAIAHANRTIEMAARACKLAEEKSMQEKVLYEAEQARYTADLEIIAQAKTRTQIENDLTRAAQERIDTEQRAIEAVTLRMDMELKAIESDNECIKQEVIAQEVATAKLAQSQALIAAEKEKEALDIRAMNMDKLKEQTLQQAIKAEEDTLRSEAITVVALRKRLEVAEENRRIAQQNEQEASRLLQLELDNQQLDLEHTLLLKQEHELGEASQLELQQLKTDLLARIEAIQQARIQAQYFEKSEAEARIETERQLAEKITQRGVVEKTAREAAAEKLALQNRLYESTLTLAHLDVKKNDGLRAELEKNLSQIETERLLSKVRKANMTSKMAVGFVAFAVSILVGFWLTGASVAGAGSATAPIATQQIVHPQALAQTAQLDLASFRLDTKLEAPIVANAQ